jgi:hypothetical protein
MKSETKPYKEVNNQRTERTLRIVVQQYSPDSGTYKTVRSFRLEAGQSLSIEKATTKILEDVQGAIR